MNTPLLAGSALALATALGAAALHATDATEDDAAEASALVKEFASTLQGELQAAMEAGGPVEAVAVCHERAPAIAETLAERSGWNVGRTSLKTRNKNNAPDAWEQQVLEQFEERKQDGQPPMGMTFAAVVDGDEGELYRFMQAIPTQGVCLACHGAEIAPEVAAALEEKYPEDQARGYVPGDIRGAFTLSKPL